MLVIRGLLGRSDRLGAVGGLSTRREGGRREGGGRQEAGA